MRTKDTKAKPPAWSLCPGGAAKTHLERELLPEGVRLRVQLVVCQPSAMLAKSPWLVATSKLKGKSSGNSPHLQGNID